MRQLIFTLSVMVRVLMIVAVSVMVLVVVRRRVAVWVRVVVRVRVRVRVTVRVRTRVGQCEAVDKEAEVVCVGDEFDERERDRVLDRDGCVTLRERGREWPVDGEGAPPTRQNTDHQLSDLLRIQVSTHASCCGPLSACPGSSIRSTHPARRSAPLAWQSATARSHLPPRQCQ